MAKKSIKWVTEGTTDTAGATSSIPEPVNSPARPSASGTARSGRVLSVPPTATAPDTAPPIISTSRETFSSRPELPSLEGTPDHMFMMMRNMTKHAGVTMWAVTMDQARTYFEALVKQHKLQDWTPRKHLLK